MKKTIILLLFLMISSRLYPATLFDPQLEWNSIKTEHFWIHYHQGIENEALKLAVIAEKVHKRLSKIIHWEPALRTDVVLVDNFYTADGFAMTFPFNRIQIYLTRPELDGVLNNFDDWLEMVFTHEYTHILNIDTVHWVPEGIRMVFGRFLFPNAYLPIWMLEGNAVFQESDYSRFGRNNSTYTDMVLRTEVLNHSLKSISEASNFPRTWPVGDVPYLYGGMFVDYLEKKYGTGSFATVFVYNSNKVIPYQDNIVPYILPFWKSTSEWVYGDSFYKLWKEWEDYLKIKYNIQLENIKKQGLTEYKKITKSGYNTVIPRFSRNGKDIFYIQSTNYNMPSLMCVSLENNKTETLCAVHDPNSISIAGNGKIYLSDAEFYRSFSIYNEAYVYDNNYKKLTGKLKGSYIDISPDGKKICFIKQDKNKFSLILTNPEFYSADYKIINSDIQLAFTRFAPDGERIAFTMKDKNGNSDIAVLSLSTGDIERITNDEFNDIQPAWHPDGNRIIFSSDRDGIYNLYEYDLKNKTIAGLTNLTGGAFNPDVSPDGKSIAFASYEKNGFDIAIMEYPGVSKVQKLNTQTLNYDYFKDSGDSIAINDKIESSGYNAFNSLFPPFWLPVFGTSEIYDNKNQYVIGVLTYGADTLFKNMYALDFYAYTLENRANVDINYLFSYLYPDIIIQYNDDTLFYGKDEFPWENENNQSIKRDMERKGAIGIAFPFYYYLSSHILSLSYQYSKSFTDIYYPGIGTDRFRDIEAKVRAKYLYSNARVYSYSVSKEDGRDFSVTSDFFRKVLGLDLTYSKVMSEYAEYLPGIWRNNVLMARLRGGASFGNPDYKSPYPLGRFEKGESGTPATDEKEFGLRGYPYGGIFGNRIAVGALEYRLPVLQKDLGIATFPLMFRDLWITPFTEYGNVWDSKTNIKEFKSSAGLELHIRITVGYEIDLEGYVGYAKGFNKSGENQFYFAISTLYEGAFKNNYKWLDYL